MSTLSADEPWKRLYIAHHKSNMVVVVHLELRIVEELLISVIHFFDWWSTYLLLEGVSSWVLRVVVVVVDCRRQHRP